MKQRPNLNKLSKEVFEANKKKGFHEVEHSNEHCLCLVISELMEAVEADRKGRRADIEKYKSAYTDWHGHESDAEKHTRAFYDTIKDTVEDELADSVIRLLDLAGCREIGLNLQDVNCGMTADISRGESFTNTIYYITRQICKVTEPSGDTLKISIINSLEEIIGLCDNLSIDLWLHVELKIKYNETSEYKHGKEY